MKYRICIMINFFYHPGYVKRKKSLFTFKLRKSAIFNKIINLAYKLNYVLPDRYITNGTHKCMNNTLKFLKANTNSKYNKIFYSNSYILQFDWYGEKILNQIIKKNIPNKKVLIGPLYTVDQLKILSNYIKNYNFIKVVAASKFSAEEIVNNESISIERKNICIIPTAIISNKELSKIKSKTRNNKCLIYFKNRNQEDLEKVITLLNSKKIEYNLFEYGNYSNSKLKKYANKSKFCILLNSTESQGLAVQEILSRNLPMIVWDLKSNINNVYASSVPYFDDRCGLIASNFNDFTYNFDNFISNLESYNPMDLIQENLTGEKFIQNLNNEFDNFFV